MDLSLSERSPSCQDSDNNPGIFNEEGLLEYAPAATHFEKSMDAESESLATKPQQRTTSSDSTQGENHDLYPRTAVRANESNCCLNVFGGCASAQPMVHGSISHPQTDVRATYCLNSSGQTDLPNKIMESDVESEPDSSDCYMDPNEEMRLTEMNGLLIRSGNCRPVNGKTPTTDILATDNSEAPEIPAKGNDGQVTNSGDAQNLFEDPPKLTSLEETDGFGNPVTECPSELKARADTSATEEISSVSTTHSVLLDHNYCKLPKDKSSSSSSSRSLDTIVKQEVIIADEHEQSEHLCAHVSATHLETPMKSEMDFEQESLSVQALKTDVQYPIKCGLRDEKVRILQIDPNLSGNLRGVHCSEPVHNVSNGNLILTELNGLLQRKAPPDAQTTPTVHYVTTNVEPVAIVETPVSTPKLPKKRRVGPEKPYYTTLDGFQETICATITNRNDLNDWKCPLCASLPQDQRMKAKGVRVKQGSTPEESVCRSFVKHATRFHFVQVIQRAFPNGVPRNAFLNCKNLRPIIDEMHKCGRVQSPNQQ